MQCYTFSRFARKAQDVACSHKPRTSESAVRGCGIFFPRARRFARTLGVMPKTFRGAV